MRIGPITNILNLLVDRRSDLSSIMTQVAKNFEVRKAAHLTVGCCSQERKRRGQPRQGNRLPHDLHGHTAIIPRGHADPRIPTIMSDKLMFPMA